MIAEGHEHPQSLSGSHARVPDTAKHEQGPRKSQRSGGEESRWGCRHLSAEGDSLALKEHTLLKITSCHQQPGQAVSRRNLANLVSRILKLFQGSFKGPRGPLLSGVSQPRPLRDLAWLPHGHQRGLVFVVPSMRVGHLTNGLAIATLGHEAGDSSRMPRAGLSMRILNIPKDHKRKSERFEAVLQLLRYDVRASNGVQHTCLVVLGQLPELGLRDQLPEQRQRLLEGRQRLLGALEGQEHLGRGVQRQRLSPRMLQLLVQSQSLLDQRQGLVGHSVPILALQKMCLSEDSKGGSLLLHILSRPGKLQGFLCNFQRLLRPTEAHQEVGLGMPAGDELPLSLTGGPESHGTGAGRGQRGLQSAGSALGLGDDLQRSRLAAGIVERSGDPLGLAGSGQRLLQAAILEQGLRQRKQHRRLLCEGLLTSRAQHRELRADRLQHLLVRRIAEARGRGLPDGSSRRDRSTGGFGIVHTLRRGHGWGVGKTLLATVRERVRVDVLMRQEKHISKKT
mmetsp:Transcript_130937/g.419189  ORF Transcript_130937/g.419189 Transcript_130937/m.419189 type:complete len:509 (+) Transcript_130937:2088-3614(+)